MVRCSDCIRLLQGDKGQLKWPIGELNGVMFMKLGGFQARSSTGFFLLCHGGSSEGGAGTS